MQVRIVVADESEARFYDTGRHDARLRQVGRIEDPQARLHDRDFKSDRPGRVFDHAPAAAGRRGAVAHHATGGEGDRRPREHQMRLFARQIAQELERAQREKRFKRIVLMAAPSFLGILRDALPQSVRLAVAAEVHKDLVHQADEVVQAHMPWEVFDSLA